MLQSSERYKEAERGLHEIVDAEYPVTRMRHLLVTGFESDFKERLKEIALGEEEDFDTVEYRTMNELISEILENEEDLKRSRQSIDSWLKGETLAPSNWDIFKVLTEINPEFQGIYDSFGEEEGFHHSYKVYVTLRQAVSNYFSNGKTCEKEKKREKINGSDRHISIKDEVELILREHFGNIIEEKYQPVKVIGVKDIKEGKRDRRNKRRSEKIESNLRKGVYVVRDNGPNLETITDKELFKDYFVLRNIFGKFIDAYVLSIHDVSKDEEFKEEFESSQISGKDYSKNDLGAICFGLFSKIIQNDILSAYVQSEKVEKIKKLSETHEQVIQELLEVLRGGYADGFFRDALNGIMGTKYKEIKIRPYYETLNHIIEIINPGFKRYVQAEFEYEISLLEGDKREQRRRKRIAKKLYQKSFGIDPMWKDGSKSLMTDVWLMRNEQKRDYGEILERYSLISTKND